jgi:hypothetical protein
MMLGRLIRPLLDHLRLPLVPFCYMLRPLILAWVA